MQTEIAIRGTFNKIPFGSVGIRENQCIADLYRLLEIFKDQIAVAVVAIAFRKRLIYRTAQEISYRAGRIIFEEEIKLKDGKVKGRVKSLPIRF